LRRNDSSKWSGWRSFSTSGSEICGPASAAAGLIYSHPERMRESAQEGAAAACRISQRQRRLINHSRYLRQAGAGV